MKKNAAASRPATRRSLGQRFLRGLYEHRYLHLMVIPGILFFLLFKYVPMYGIITAFKTYKGCSGRPDHLERRRCCPSGAPIPA